MSRRFAALTLALAFAWLIPVRDALGADPLRAFPPADADTVRYVIQLEPRDQESDFRVEVIAGKTVSVDTRNRHFFSGKIKAETIRGWGYTCYRVGRLGPLAGTRIAVDPSLPKVERFVAIGGEPLLVPYNSRLPLVIYAPPDVEVRYRVWSAPAESREAAKG